MKTILMFLAVVLSAVRSLGVTSLEVVGFGDYVTLGATLERCTESIPVVESSDDLSTWGYRPELFATPPRVVITDQGVERLEFQVNRSHKRRFFRLSQVEPPVHDFFTGPSEIETNIKDFL